MPPGPEEDWIAVPVQPIVSEQTFAQVQAKLDANQQGAARNTRHEYLLRALISCGACRLGCTGRQTAAGYRYLTAPSHIRPHGACSDCASRLVRHHLATVLRIRLLLEQVTGPAGHRQPGRRRQGRSADPR
jgi:site-specific DNA recombinase